MQQQQQQQQQQQPLTGSLSSTLPAPRLRPSPAGFRFALLVARRRPLRALLPPLDISGSEHNSNPATLNPPPRLCLTSSPEHPGCTPYYGNQPLRVFGIIPLPFSSASLTLRRTVYRKNARRTQGRSEAARCSGDAKLGPQVSRKLQTKSKSGK
ncbi:hypothetical protein HN011_012304 [Eciton burchellii]|nr:hypothetical protein HN011_012304 [Eciton burchellii]